MSLEVVPVALAAAALGILVEKLLTCRRSRRAAIHRNGSGAGARLAASRRPGSASRALPMAARPDRRQDEPRPPLLDADAVATLIDLGYSRREALEAIARAAGTKARERALRAFKDNGARFTA